MFVLLPGQDGGIQLSDLRTGNNQLIQVMEIMEHYFQIVIKGM